MKIQGNQGLLVKKIGHCCLVVETNGKRIMTDPGGWSTGQVLERDLDLVLVTHEHGDHLHIESLKKVLENNPNCKVVTNNAVKKLLDAEKISCEILEEGNMDTFGINIFAKTCKHADIFDGITPVENTGYMIGDKLFYPGDAWLLPEREVEILALPVAGPWSKIRDSLEYCIKVNPKFAFPVHDALIQDFAYGPFHNLPKGILGGKGIEFVVVKSGEEKEF
jgi:L-ascorbate metabolism protein UlaG (beta-lactamase superfamily)